MLADDAGHRAVPLWLRIHKGLRGRWLSHISFVTGTGAWARYEVTAQIPADACLVRFGVFLNGGGQVELRQPELAPHPLA